LPASLVRSLVSAVVLMPRRIPVALLALATLMREGTIKL
jgi:hypothetical protein